MTNKEKYAKELLDILCETGKTPGMIKGKIVACDGDLCNCNDCKFGKPTIVCPINFKNWAKAEYEAPEIDWTKVPENTRILVRDRDNNPWLNAHFAYYRNGHVFAFPYGRTSWTIAPDMTICPWNCAEIADPNEQGKYLKYE